MPALYSARPFERKITFPMAFVPFLNAVEDVMKAETWRGFMGELSRTPHQPINGILYVHVPFCKSLCTHCSYDRVVYRPGYEKAYLERLLGEIVFYSTRPLIQSTEFLAVHLGGGTPNVLSAETLKIILTEIKRRFRLKHDAVVNVEIGTKAYSSEIISLLKELGCNRISFGIQSFDEVVRKNCALTTSAETLRTIAQDLARLGFDISFDLMYALPGQDVAVWRNDLEQAVALNPVSLDLYCYYPLHTKLHRRIKQGRIKLPTESELLQMIETTISFLEEKGYCQETAEDFAKPGKVNIIKAYGYAKVEDSDDYVYLALGPNAMGFVRNYTYRNKFYSLPSALNYLSKTHNDHNLPLFLLEHFTDQKQRNLAMFPRAIAMKKERIGVELLDRFADRLAGLARKELLTDADGYLALTDLGRLWIDNISYELMYDHIQSNFGSSIFSFPQSVS